MRFDLSRDEWRLLAGLAELGPTRTTELMLYSTMQKMPASRAAARLEERGPIERSTAEDDRRNHVLKLARPAPPWCARSSRWSRPASSSCSTP
ncbi:MAG: winged helix-turn-helix transcriptional regulator [Ideonella sp.]|nr:winged helix-turn-helix transcriptional regulator [Ideonella sp.]